MRREIERFARAREGAATVTTVVFLVFLLGVIGLTVDVGRAYIEHSRLQNFVDAAASAAALELDGEPDSLDRARSVLRAESLAARAIYSENAGSAFTITPTFLTGPPTRDANGAFDFEGLRTETASEASHLVAQVSGRSVAWSLLTLLTPEAGGFSMSASAVASVARTTARDIEVTFAVDNSPSMLIGATPDAISELRRTENCAFACHYNESDVRAFFDGLRATDRAVRLHAAIDSIQATLELAQSATLSGGASIFFDVNTFAYEFEPLPGGRGDVDDLSAEAIGAILPAPEPNSNRFEATDPRRLGDLAARVRQKVEFGPDRDQAVVVITDGVADFRDGSRRIRAFSPADCAELKALGVTVGVIYTTYLPLPANGFWRNNVDPIDEDIAPNLEACASPGFFFEAAFAEDIEAAFTELLRRQITVEGVTLTD
ncbi:MAG: pilus assembly protein TadG-related protein [Pseudomonadota bacterium]